MGWRGWCVFGFGAAWRIALWAIARFALPVGPARTIPARRRAAILVVAVGVNLYGFRRFEALRAWAFHSGCERHVAEKLAMRVELDHSASSLERHRDLKRVAFRRPFQP
ncbi:hypothetical protein [Paludisphaera soli]|uniref:hypothetical protein n=1 Tax=Paludisphaera soli TaxID=2712865 RepID=UPI0013EA31CB|nr:hypothetical protein [Paludisphaera soli]